MHPSSSFLTLTYDDENVPSDGSLDRDAFPGFMKRLRRKFPAGALRYFHCGEYGSENLRPHYHAVLFGTGFEEDRWLWKTSEGSPLYRSPTLESAWKVGFALIGAVTFESAAYVARYCCSRKNPKEAVWDRVYSMWRKPYERLDPHTGELYPVEPEFATMSNRPGIGESWFRAFSSDVYPSDEVISRGRAAKPPRYYDKLLEREDNALLVELKRRRKEGRRLEDETADRLAVRETCTRLRLGLRERKVS